MPGVSVSKVAFAAMKAFTPQEPTSSQISLQEPQFWPVEPRFWLVPSSISSKAVTPQDKTEPLTPQFLSFVEDIPTFSELSAYFRSDGGSVKDEEIVFSEPEEPVPRDEDSIVGPVERDISLQPKHLAALSGAFFQGGASTFVVTALLVL